MTIKTESSDGYSPGPAGIDRILAEAKECRKAQDAQWGGPEHDDTHAADDWLGFIIKQVDAANDALDPVNQWEPADEWKSKFVVYESRMINVAALAIAAIQSSRRKRGDR